MGHMTISTSRTISTPGLSNAVAAEYGWGIYRDVDIATSATDLPAYSAGYSNSWMVHKTGTVVEPFIFSQSTTDQAFGITPGVNDLQYRRYELDLRKYKRTLDSLNDTLILSVENSSSSTVSIAYSFYFRMLLLE